MSAWIGRQFALAQGYQTGLRAGVGANRPAKSALRVSNFGPDAAWARLNSGARTLTKRPYFQALPVWARLGSNQRPLAGEAIYLRLQILEVWREKRP
jgi:hypothetical protein